MSDLPAHPADAARRDLTAAVLAHHQLRDAANAVLAAYDADPTGTHDNQLDQVIDALREQVGK